MTRAIELHVTSANHEAVRQGLAVARSLVRRRFLDAFDKGGTDVLCLLMGDIAEAMEHLDTQEDDTKLLASYISELLTKQTNDEYVEIV